MFVVNHAMDEPGVDRIERFVYNPDTLELHHKDFYSGEEMKVSVLFIIFLLIV